MKRALLDWLDHRTGARGFLHALLYENIPGGARWRYVWGSTLMFAFGVQLVTGIVLWAAYSPSSQTAWESVYYIEYVMAGGSLLRGIHHYTAQAMVVLLVLHLAQVVVDGAYRAPREVNYWFGMALLLLVLGLSLTGYLLPWDQKGYWATKVATNMAGVVPVVGPIQQRLLVGGVEYGHHTLTRFFALHAGLLPGLVVALTVGHVYLFRRHGITAKQPPAGPDARFWPDQALRDAVACLALTAAVLALALWKKAELGPPADPAEPYAAARPEWYFLFLYQFLKLFPGNLVVLSGVVIPGGVLMILALFPVIGRWPGGHRFNCGFLVALLVGATVLTGWAVAEDRGKPEYQAALRQNEATMERMRELASGPTGIPVGGALELLRQDPKTQGAKLFAQHCAKCHTFDGHDGTGAKPKEAPTAADLKGFGSRAWLAGLLDPARIETAAYFGNTKFCKPPAGKKKGKMVKFVLEDLAGLGDADKAKLAKVIAAVSAEAALPAQAELDKKEAAAIAEGRTIIADGKDPFSCIDCHEFRNNEKGSGPGLTGWGSREWMVAFVKNPAHERFYEGEHNDRMPAFEKEMDAKAIETVVDWLRGAK
jgi:ubiquinol-cytochrome c reductase cytochrome b subunit